MKKNTKKEEVNVSKRKKTSKKKNITKSKKVIENKKEKKKFYYSYKLRLMVNLLAFSCLLILGLFFLIKSFELEETKKIAYSEQSSLDYNVYLKANNFYEEAYLPKDMLYVANLIDRIKIDFNYSFVIDEPINLNFQYEILGKLVIQDELEDNVYYSKVYTLLAPTNLSLVDSKVQNINKSIDIDYGKYNDIANNFKNSYGVNIKSKLIIYFNIVKKTVDNEENNILVNDNSNNMLVSIPLSEKSVDIGLDYKDINNESKVLDNSKVVIDNIIYLFLSIIAIIGTIVFMLNSIKLFKYMFKKKNIYDKYIEKILNSYDRLIVETTTPPIMEEDDKFKIVTIDKFTELLDVRDNLKEPIMYYIVTKHQKCHFYITTDNKIYITTIKKVDLEAENEKK